MGVDLPLSGKKIVVTRSEDQSESVTADLQKLGATVFSLPMIRIEPARLSSEDASLVAGFARYDTAIFTSVNAVRCVAARVAMSKGEGGKPFVIAIGKKTAEVLHECGVAADFVPSKHNSAELLNSFSDFEWKNKRVLIPKGSLSGGELAEAVRSRGGSADEVVVYNTLANDALETKLKERIASGQFDIVIFFSPSQIRSFLVVFDARVLDGKKVAVIGPTTRKAAEKFGLIVDVEPENSTTENLISSLVENERA
jgi:uroporphyrinogen-III synthase